MRTDRPADTLKPVLVTGGAGFVGSHIVDLLRQERPVHVLDDLSAGTVTNVPSEVCLHVADIRDEEALRRILREVPFGAIVHCAAQTSVARSMREPQLDWDVNVCGTFTLATLAAGVGVERFVYISSGGAIYGETGSAAEIDTLPAPRSYYGLHKFAAEQVVRAATPSWAILRPANIYGPRQRSDLEGGVIAVFLDRLQRGEPLALHGGGDQQRDFVYVSDVAAAVQLALATPQNVNWNVATGCRTSIRELANMLAELSGRTAPIHGTPRREGDITSSILSPAALLRTGRWGPPLPLRAGLQQLVAESLAIREPVRPSAGR